MFLIRLPAASPSPGITANIYIYKNFHIAAIFLWKHIKTPVTRGNNNIHIYSWEFCRSELSYGLLDIRLCDEQHGVVSLVHMPGKRKIAAFAGWVLRNSVSPLSVEQETGGWSLPPVIFDIPRKDRGVRSEMCRLKWKGTSETANLGYQERKPRLGMTARFGPFDAQVRHQRERDTAWLVKNMIYLHYIYNVIRNSRSQRVLSLPPLNWTWRAEICLLSIKWRYCHCDKLTLLPILKEVLILKSEVQGLYLGELTAGSRRVVKLTGKAQDKVPSISDHVERLKYCK